jgi:hypothetical protein
MPSHSGFQYSNNLSLPAAATYSWDNFGIPAACLRDALNKIMGNGISYA